MGRPKKVEKKPNKDGFYRVDRTIGKDINGKPIVKIFRSKKSYDAALQKAEKYMQEKDVSGIMFEEWATKWLWEYKAPTVRENTFEYTYRNSVEKHLIPYFKHFKLKDISSFMIQQFFNANQHLSKSTLSKFKITLEQIYEAAIANRLVDFSPVIALNIKSKQKPKPKEAFTKEEITIIINEAKKHKNGLPILIMAFMGLRPSEMCGLKWEDIDLDAKTLSVKRACTSLCGKTVIGDPKNEPSNRTIPIPDELVEILRANKSKGFVLLNTVKKPMTPDKFAKNIHKPFLESIGIRYLSPHKMRHTKGTLIYLNTHDIYAAQTFLGHSNAAVTSSIYVHPDVEDLRKQTQEKKAEK